MLLVSVLFTSVSLGASAQEKEKGIALNFKDTPLETILHYLSEEADLVVVSDYNLTDRITVMVKPPCLTIFVKPKWRRVKPVALPSILALITWKPIKG